MKTLPGNGKVSGLTLIELLVVVCVIALVAAMLLPTMNGSRKATMAVCINNQRQISIAFNMFQSDNNGKNPWQVSVTNGGSMESIPSYQAFLHFRVLSNYFGNGTHQFVCPADVTRPPASNYAELANTNISYFLNMDAVTNSTSVLLGDRYLEANGKPIKSGLLVQSTNMTMNWSDGFHHYQDQPAGYLLLSDQHIEQTPTWKLKSVFQNQPLATNRFCFP